MANEIKQIKINKFSTDVKLENENKLQLTKEGELYSLSMKDYSGKFLCIQYLKTDAKRISTINKCLKEKGYNIEFVE